MQQEQHPSQSTLPPALANMLAETRTKFIDQLISFVIVIEFQKQVIADPARAPEAFETIRHICHKVSGLAGTVGFAALGQKAAELDSAFARLCRSPHDSKVVGAINQSLEQFLDMMEEALDADL